MLYIFKSCRTFSKRVTESFVYFHASSQWVNRYVSNFYTAKALYCTHEHAGNPNQLPHNRGLEEIGKREQNNSYFVNEIWEEDDFQSPEKRVITKRGKMRDKCTELVSDEESDAEYYDKLEDIDYKILPKRSFKLSYDVINTNSTKDGRHNSTFRLEAKPTIIYLMKKGIIPQKIYFTNLSDVLALNQPINGIQLYKVHEEDLTFWMSTPNKNGLIAIFDKRDIQSKRSIQSDFPVHVVYQGKQHSGFHTQILRSAVVCGCKSVIFVGGRFYKLKLGDNALALSTMHLDFNYCNWFQIEKQFSPDIPVLVVGSNENNNNDLPKLNLYDVEHLPDNEAIILISTKPSAAASSFLSHRKAWQITTPSYILPEHNGQLPIIFTLCVFELRRKWEMMKCKNDQIG